MSSLFFVALVTCGLFSGRGNRVKVGLKKKQGLRSLNEANVLPPLVCLVTKWMKNASLPHSTPRQDSHNQAFSHFSPPSFILVLQKLGCICSTPRDIYSPVSCRARGDLPWGVQHKGWRYMYFARIEERKTSLKKLGKDLLNTMNFLVQFSPLFAVIRLSTSIEERKRCLDAISADTQVLQSTRGCTRSWFTEWEQHLRARGEAAALSSIQSRIAQFRYNLDPISPLSL